jgi:hypothetical protein
MATENATWIGEKLGKLFGDYGANTKGVHFCKFLRIRVEIKIRIRVEKEKIKYGSSSNMKSLSDFCYSCGRLGHAASICDVKEDSPFKGKFGLEMRATETSWSKLEFSYDHITHTHTHTHKKRGNADGGKMY